MIRSFLLTFLLVCVRLPGIGQTTSTPDTQQATPNAAQAQPSTQTSPAGTQQDMPPATPESEQNVESLPGYRMKGKADAQAGERTQSAPASPTGGQERTPSLPQPPSDTQPSLSAPQPSAAGAAPGVSTTQQQPGGLTPLQTPSLPQPPPAPTNEVSTMPAYQQPSPEHIIDNRGSTYVPLDSWVYPAILRLYSLGYVDSAFLGMRPWTRLSILNMLNETSPRLDAAPDTPGTQEAQDIVAGLRKMVDEDGSSFGSRAELDSIYARFLGISGTALIDSFHLGQTIENDYGRPDRSGFNALSGVSARAEAGRFSFYVRGEYQHSPTFFGYTPQQASIIGFYDFDGNGGAGYPYQPLIPVGTLSARNGFRLLEANLAYHIAGHEISFGRSDAWLGPALGGAFSWSNNAENVYSFRINRVEPLRIPLVSRAVGPIRYDFFVGPLKGHRFYRDPWVHAEKFSFKPTQNVEIGFSRTVIWGGEGHEAVNLHTFLRSFFSISDTTDAEKRSNRDPGARFSQFDFTWRLPFVRNYATLYLDSFVHDDVTPPSAPRRSAWLPGIYISHFPGAPKLDFRVEGVSTDPPTGRSVYGNFLYHETIVQDGYTNNGFVIGDWIGREGKGGNAWLTYHLSPSEYIQLEYQNKKNAKDFIPSDVSLEGGTTQNDFRVNVVKRLGEQLELNGWVQYERWKAPVYKPGLQTDTSAALQITFYPKLSQKLWGKQP